MATEERAAVVAGVHEPRQRSHELLAAIGGLSPPEPASRWWGGDPLASPRLRNIWMFRGDRLMSESDVDREIVRLARALQSSMHNILASVIDLEPADRAVAMRDTEPLRRVSIRLDQALAEYDRLRKLLDLAGREPPSRRIVRGGRRSGQCRGGAARPARPKTSVIRYSTYVQIT